jgi:hypothetical protein
MWSPCMWVRKTLSILEKGMPMALYLATVPEPQSNTNWSPLPTSTKTLLHSWSILGTTEVPRKVILISSLPSVCLPG